MIKFRSLSALLLITTIIFNASISGSAQTVADNKSAGKTAAAAPAKRPVVGEDIERDVAEALAIIENEHVVGVAIDYNSLVKSSIEGMLGSLDPHSNYFDAKEFEQFRTDQSSRYFGIGATIGDLTDPDGKIVGTYIRATFDGAPAHRAGLRYGDKIIEVNGKPMVGKPFPEVRDELRGPRGTPAKLIIERYGTGQRETIQIVRDAVPQPSISEAYMIRPGVGYIGMKGGFNQTTYAEFVEAMKRLKAQGMQQLVLDLKNNGGGLVGQAYRVANTFLSRGQTVFTQKGRIQGVTEPYRAENPSPEGMPVVVLVNRNSASASEILAGALQDHDRALIVGETTFGKGLVQNPFVLDYGSMLLLTIAKYETPSGRLIQRDYSDGGLYSYYTKGGVGREDEDAVRTPTGPEARTDLGRVVYSGGGINPDIAIKPDTIPIEQARFQQKLANPIFSYAMDLAFGKIAGFETLKIDRPIDFSYDLKPNDLKVSDRLFEQFKKYAVSKYKYTAAEIDREREYIERTLRVELVTAAYGSTTSFQVYNEADNQIIGAIDVLPQARQLAMDGAKARSNAASRQTANER